MCAVSAIYDMFRPMPDDWYTLDRIDLFKNMVAQAAQFDIETGQPDCADPEKAKMVAHIAELEEQLGEEHE